MLPTWDECASIHAPARGATHKAAVHAQSCAASIHAPARGATDLTAADGSEQAASIHAPARGATVGACEPQHTGALQSTLPHGERLLRAGRASRPGWRASIHAPARGATVKAIDGNMRTICFNPRSRTGSDSDLVTVESPNILLQSTLPHGERPKHADHEIARYGLQSTLPHGERRLDLQGLHW